MSNKLKELTWAHHQSAERRVFARELISGNVDPHKYYTFLVCQYYNYTALENTVVIPKELEAIKRADLIMEDIEELEKLYEFERPEDYPPSVAEYVYHIYDLVDGGDNEKLLAHMYTRHFGELHGGQIIKKKAPGSGKMYDFAVDRQFLIDEFRLLLHDGMADEAKICFDFASKLFDELS
jgi:heme oxygenase